MKQIIYELCEQNKSCWGYGIFDGEKVDEIALEDIIDMVDNEEFENAKLCRNQIVMTNCKAPLPRFYKDDYDIVDDFRLYVIGLCRVNGERGYLVVHPLCKLTFVTRYELINLCYRFISSNVKLRELSDGDDFPVQVNQPFKYIGEIALEE